MSNLTTTDKGLIFNIQKFSLNDGPGIRTVVFFKGCPLRCKWCANPESQSGRPETMYDEQKQTPTMIGEYKTVAEIMQVILQDRDFYAESGGGVTFSGGEVLFQAPFAIELAQAIHAAGISVMCETTGYAAPAVFQQFMQQMDFMYYDCKHWDSQQHRQGAGGGNELILQNLQTAIDAQQALTVRIPIIPGFNYDLSNAHHFGELFQKMGITNIELLPFHQFGLKKYRDLGRDYALADVKQLQSDDLLNYQAILSEYGVIAKINGW
ncbi:glycyl-radical enzyme activating protein [Loigolactobacillus jiayinensis]|uniref:Glycyl-radical enzyme activating protein n=1 Tax=Loigolactobacillus jiayinensis TaxID=2486016 RepID=A0ABW1RDD4_9LACO|nr:glycyl-radical enzyme activating protein [Loigolactobacillus jiayinensis]